MIEGEFSMAIKKCSCKEYLGNKSGAEYQDKKHGRGQRVHTPDKSTPTKWTCTVCETQR